MKNKNRDPAPGEGAEVIQAQPGAEAPAATAPVAEPAARWRENTWNGMPHFECLQCPYDTLDKSEMEAHIRAHDAPAAPARRFRVRRLDRFDNPVEGG